MCVCARVRAGEGGAGGAARPARRLRGRHRGPPVAARAPQRAAQLGVPATRAAAPGRSPGRGRGEAGAGPGPGPPRAGPPARRTQSGAGSERAAGAERAPGPCPAAPRAPRAPRDSPARQLTSRREPPQRPASPRQTSAPLPPPAAGRRAPSPTPGPRAGLPHPYSAPLLPRGRLGAPGCCPRLRAKVDGVGGLHCMACPRTRPPRARAPPRGLTHKVEASLQSAWWAPAAGGGAAAAAAEARLGSGGEARRERC